MNSSGAAQVGVVAGEDRCVADDAPIGLGDEHAEPRAGPERIAADDGRREALGQALVAVERVGQPGDDGGMRPAGTSDADGRSGLVAPELFRQPVQPERLQRLGSGLPSWRS
jgi:hypothetical protein